MRIVPGSRGVLLGVLGVTAVCASAVIVPAASAVNPDCLGLPPGTPCVEDPLGEQTASDGGSPITQDQSPGNNNVQPGLHDNGRGGNTFVNDPCIDPPPPERRRTVQSETEVAVFGTKYLVAGWNDSFGFYDNTQGLSGFGYSVDGGNTWIDGGGLPPRVPDHGPAGTPGSDHYFGDPVIVVDRSPRTFRLSDGTTVSQPAGTFYYASIYQDNAGLFTLSVNRGRFQTAPPQTPETRSSTRCLNHPELQGVANTANLPTERVVWERPVEAVQTAQTPDDFLDKEWLYVNQATGELYLTYTRFGEDGSTPLELVRSEDGGRTWEGPFVIVPNLGDTFNQATQPAVTSTGRLIITWIARTFAANGSGPESDNRIEYAISDDDGTTFSTPRVIQHVNPQGEPPGYNRNRRSILNAPYINTYPHGTDVYITYFNGKTPLEQGGGIFTGPLQSAADVMLAASHDNGTTFSVTKVNDDAGTSSHVFPSVQVNKIGWVFTGWIDRRNSPSNELSDTWAAVSKDGGATFGHSVLQTDVATSWRVRADARPNFGDYNSSELLGDNQFVQTWADGRFIAQGQTATPDTIFTISNGLGVGTG